MAMVKIVRTPDTEVPVEVIAESVVAMAEGIRKLRAGRLNDRALILLIRDAAPNTNGSKYPKKYLTNAEVRAVLDGIEALEATYIRKIVKK